MLLYPFNFNFQQQHKGIALFLERNEINKQTWIKPAEQHTNITISFL
jgi:hypothetical protein